MQNRATRSAKTVSLVRGTAPKWLRPPGAHYALSRCRSEKRSARRQAGSGTIVSPLAGGVRDGPGLRPRPFQEGQC